MEALAANQFGDYQDVLEFQVVSPPICEAHDVLIKVSYTDLNPVDLQKLSGGATKKGQPVPNPPFIPGYGGSGIVQQVGTNGPHHLLDKPVVFLADPSRGGGSYASLIAVDGRCVAEVPSHISLRTAATIPVAGLTAYECLVKLRLVQDQVALSKTKATLETAGLESKSGGSSKNGGDSDDSSLLIVGASGGVGSWLLSLVRLWHPNKTIIATASSPEWCQQLGATKVIQHNEISSFLSGGPEGSVDDIICLTEPTKELFHTLSEVIKPYGNIVLVVSGAKAIHSMDLSFLFFKCVNILTETVFSSIRTKYQRIVPAQELRAILRLLDSQALQAPISPLLDSISEKFKDALDEKVGALKVLASKTGHAGNLVMMINSDDNIVFVDFKTASFLTVPRLDCIKKNMINRVKRQGDEVWEAQTQTIQEKEDLIKLLCKNEHLDIVKVAKKQSTDYQDGLQLQEAENVKNLWGVQLKKRQKKIKMEKN